ncbi:MAG: hypothetical protein M9924_14825 [Rhizobiaceae bacterium]|nr:hypothetical protein [Rhizobiaceae bacterium]
MNAKHVDSYADFSNILYEMDATISKINAFCGMMEHTLNSGDDVREISSGVGSMLLQQCDDLRHLRSALLREFNRLKKKQTPT